MKSVSFSWESTLHPSTPLPPPTFPPSRSHPNFLLSPIPQSSPPSILSVCQLTFCHKLYFSVQSLRNTNPSDPYPPVPSTSSPHPLSQVLVPPSSFHFGRGHEESVTLQIWPSYENLISAFLPASNEGTSPPSLPTSNRGCRRLCLPDDRHGHLGVLARVAIEES